MNKKITIITTTYNRAHLLRRLYDSLCKQSNKNFKWLVVDDGSSDNTKEVIEGLKKENKVNIEYHYHENKGMVASREVAYHLVDSELNMIVDSDDWVAPEAIDKIIKFWEANKNEKIAGIIALNQSEKGNIIGKKFPDNMKTSTYTYLNENNLWGGDKKLIYRSDITKKYPYPLFEDEKYFPPSYKFVLIDLDYEMLLMNEVVCIIGEDGNDRNTYNKIKQYKTSPKSFALYRNTMMRIWNKPLLIAKEALHYIAVSLFAKDYKFIKKASRKGYVIVLLPLGILFYFYLKYTKRKSLRFNKK